MRRAAGFTLLEVLVALAVLAIAMGAIIEAATRSIETTGYLRDRTFASWVALNKINELLLDNQPWPAEGARTGSVDLASRSWRWEARFHKTDDPDLRRLEVTVRASETGPELDKLIAFRGKPPKKPEKPAEESSRPSMSKNPPPTPDDQSPTPGQSADDTPETMPQS